MKKLILFLFLSTSLFCFGQGKSALKDIQSIKFYGVDYSQVKIFGADESPIQFKDAFRRINELFITEAKKYNVGKQLKKEVTEISLDAVNQVNENINVAELMTTKREYSLSKEQIKAARRNQAGNYAFLAPAAIIYLSVIVIPLIYSIYISFHKWNGVKAMEPVGIANYIRLFTEDDVFKTAFRNNLVWILLSVVVATALALAFALVLIAAGVLLIVYQLVPQFDLLKILKFSPVILIALGIEMLVYSARPDVKAKFDWLAMLGTAFTLCIVGTAALLPLAISEWNPAREYARNRIESQKADAMYSAMTADPALKAKLNSLNVEVHFFHEADGDYTLQSGDDCILYAALQGPYADAETFAADCMAVMQRAADDGLGFTCYHFDADEDTDDGISYYLDCVASYPAGLTAAQVAQRVQASYHYDNNSFSSEADRDDYIRRQLQNEISDEYADRHDGAYPDEKYLNEETERRFAERTGMATPESAQA